MNSSRLIFGILRVPIDFGLALSALLLAYRVRQVTDLIPGRQFVFAAESLPAWEVYLPFSLFASGFLVLMFVLTRLYDFYHRPGHGKLAAKILFLVSAWVLFIIAYYALVRHELFFSRIALFQAWIFAFIFIFLGRELMRLIEAILLRYGVGRTRLLLVGVNSFTQTCYDQLKNDRRYEVIGALAQKDVGKKKVDFKIVGYLDQFEPIIKKFKVGAVVQVDPKMDEEMTFDLLYYCRSKDIEYYMAPDVLGLQQANVGMEMIDELPLIHLKHTPLEGWGYIVKRAFDVFASFLAILILIPFWLIIALLIKLDSKGPVFYKSKRKYRDKVFFAYKFRSMIVGAEAMRKKLLDQNEREGPLFKIKKDPRVTRIGRFLRKTSLDELPQLLNVLKGDMSLVGPRPHLPEEVDQYEKHHYQVFAIKPGLTGLAQVNGRSNLDFEEEVKLDIYYIENWSLWLDIKLMIRSVLIIFRADGH